MVETAFAIPLALSLSIPSGGVRVSLPVGLLVAGVLRPPLLLAVGDHLRIRRIGLDLPPVVIGTATPLSLREATITLLRVVGRRLDGLLAIGTTTRLDHGSSSKVRNQNRTSEHTRNVIPLRSRNCYRDLETAVECVPRPRRWDF